MSRPLEPVVPAALAALLGGELADSEGFTVQLLTVREDGWPHAAMLSAGEIVLVDERRLRLALWPDSTSVANLVARRVATLAAVPAPASYLVRVAVAPLGPLETPLAGRLAAFDAAVQAVTVDEAPYAVLEGGISYRLTEPEPALARWAETRRALLELGG